MKRTNLLHALVLLVSVSFLFGCTDLGGPAEREIDIERLALDISETEDFQTLEHLSRQMIAMLLEAQVPVAAFRNTFESEDLDAVYPHLSSKQVVKLGDIQNRLSRASINLRRSFPELDRLEGSEFDCSIPDRLEQFIDRYEGMLSSGAQDADHFNPNSLMSSLVDDEVEVPIDDDDPDVTCQWGQYTVCLSLAGYGSSVFGPAAAFAFGGAAYLCLCSYCEGGWVDWVCF